MDRISKEARSRNMARIKSRGNRTTEKRLRALLAAHGFRGWHVQPQLDGNPDFAFPRLRVAVFVDGCFWHGCAHCGHIPKSNQKYWKAKISRNMQRDRSNTRRLRRLGWSVVRFWEHELKGNARSNALRRLRRVLKGRVISARR